MRPAPSRVRACLAAAACLIPAAAQAMDADSFYLRGRALEAKGMAAMFSKDLKPLMAEMKAATAAVTAENDAAKARGAPLYCPPAKAKMDHSEVLNGIGAIPMAERQRMSVRDAWKRMLVAKWPC